MTDDQLTFRDAFARDDLERSERLSLAVTMVWFAVAVLAMMLTVALVSY
jgi:hypothetical protein